MSVTFEFGDDIFDMAEELVESFDFTLPGLGGETLGRDIAVGVAVGIAERSNKGLDIDGQPFEPNEEAYAKYKLKRYSVDRPGELGGQMLSLTSLLGEVSVTPTLVKLTYGTGTTPSGSARNGVALHEYETRKTDREKAEYFAATGRHFYGLDVDIITSIEGIAQENLDFVVASLG